jgi:LysR family glycine cleavage system transcriptional activator
VPSYVRDLASYWIVYPPHARNTAKIKAFRDWIMAEIASEIAADPEGRYLPR